MGPVLPSKFTLDEHYIKDINIERFSKRLRLKNVAVISGKTYSFVGLSFDIINVTSQLSEHIIA